MSERHSPFDWSAITDHFYIATPACCGAHFSSLRELGIDADIDLDEEHIEREFLGAHGQITVFLWLPVKDKHVQERSSSPSALGQSTPSLMPAAASSSIARMAIAERRTPLPPPLSSKVQPLMKRSSGFGEAALDPP